MQVNPSENQDINSGLLGNLKLWTTVSDHKVLVVPNL